MSKAPPREAGRHCATASIEQGTDVDAMARRLTLMLALAVVMPWVTSPAMAGSEAALIRLLQTKSCPRCNLADADLMHADLRDATLTSAELQRANLSQARLDGADLSNSGLSFTSLRGASLRGAGW